MVRSSFSVSRILFFVLILVVISSSFIQILLLALKQGGFMSYMMVAVFMLAVILLVRSVAVLFRKITIDGDLLTIGNARLTQKDIKDYCLSDASRISFTTQAGKKYVLIESFYSNDQELRNAFVKFFKHDSKPSVEMETEVRKPDCCVGEQVEGQIGYDKLIRFNLKIYLGITLILLVLCFFSESFITITLIMAALCVFMYFHGGIRFKVSGGELLIEKQSFFKGWTEYCKTPLSEIDEFVVPAHSRGRRGHVLYFSVMMRNSNCVSVEMTEFDMEETVKLCRLLCESGVKMNKGASDSSVLFFMENSKPEA